VASRPDSARAQVVYLQKVAGEFLWWGQLERLAYYELHLPLSEGGPWLSSLPDKAQSLLANHACHCLASGGRPAQHIIYWVGLRLRHTMHDLVVGLHAEAILGFFNDFAALLLHSFCLPKVRPE
jgi:hypothetical protein